MSHTVMTFVAQVKPEKKADLSALLDTIGNNPETNPYVRAHDDSCKIASSHSLFDGVTFAVGERLQPEFRLLLESGLAG